MSRAKLPLRWIRELAEPYLRGYPPQLQRSGGLQGYWFLRLPSRPPPRKSVQISLSLARSRGLRGSQDQIGFFVGYLIRAQEYALLNPQPPECLVFAFVHPVGGSTHRRLVARPGSLLRSTFDYIRWLTHRPPRFAFYPDKLPAMVRHLSMRDWPQKKYQHYSRNFFIETLAWLVRSGLVRKFLAEPNLSRT